MSKRNKNLRKSSNDIRNNVDELIETPMSVDIINEIEEHNDENCISKEQKESIPEEEIIARIKETYNLDIEGARQFAKNKITFTYDDNGNHSPAFDYRFELGMIHISINTSHIFYISFLEKIYQLDESIRTTFKLFLASFVKTVDLISWISEEQEKANDKLVNKWLSKITEYTIEQCDD